MKKPEPTYKFTKSKHRQLFGSRWTKGHAPETHGARFKAVVEGTEVPDAAFLQALRDEYADLSGVSDADLLAELRVYAQGKCQDHGTKATPKTPVDPRATLIAGFKAAGMNDAEAEKAADEALKGRTSAPTPPPVIRPEESRAVADALKVPDGEEMVTGPVRERATGEKKGWPKPPFSGNYWVDSLAWLLIGAAIASYIL